MKKLLLIFLLFPLFVSSGEAPYKIGFVIPVIPPKVNAFGLVQSAAVQIGVSVTSKANTISSSGVNNLVVVYIHIITAAMTVTSVTDNQSNAYVVGSSLAVSTGLLYQAYGVQETGGVTSVTVNLSGTTTLRCFVDEFSGFVSADDNTSVLDSRQTGTGTGTSGSVSTITPAATGELIVGTMIGQGQPFTAGSGYTLTGDNNLRGQYKLSCAATETAPFTLNASALWGEIATAYKTGTTPPPNNSKFFFKP